MAIDSPELRPVGVDGPHQPIPSQDGPGAAAALPGSSPIGGPRGAHEVSEHGSQEGLSRRPQQLASVASASARNPASSPSWSRSWVRRGHGEQRGLEVVGGLTDEQPGGVPARALRRLRHWGGRGAGHRLRRVRHTGYPGWRHRNRSPGQRWTDNVPEVGRHHQLGGLLHEYQRAACNRSVHLRQSRAASAHLRASARPDSAGRRSVAMPGRAGRATARLHAGLARPGRRAAAFAGLRWVQDRSGPPAAPPVAK
jgi:hypothetical protein